MTFSTVCVCSLPIFDRDAVGAVCTPDASNPWETADLLDALVNQSMLGAQAGGDTTRYRLLETFRQFGETQIEPGVLRDLRHRHLRYYIELAAGAQAEFALPDTHESSVETFTREWTNLRAAMHWATATRDGPSCGDLIEHVRTFATLSLLDEIGEWASDALEITPCSHSVITMASWAQSLRGNITRSVELATTAAQAAPADSLALLMLLGAQARSTGMADPAFVETARKLPALARREPDIGDRAMRLAAAANLLALGDASHSAAVAAEVEALLRSGVGVRIEAQARAWLARTAQLRNDDETARSHCRQVHRLSEALPGRLWADQIALHVDADVALMRNDADAPTIASGALEALVGSGDWYDCWTVLEPVGFWMHSHGERRAAAIIAGFFDEHGIACRVPQRTALFASLIDDPTLQRPVERGRTIDKVELVDQIHALLQHKSITVPSIPRA